MLIGTWNVNSVRAREARLLAWLERNQPDVLCLQELKGLEEAFPTKAVNALGYHAAVFGQRTYNGVAILSKTPLKNVTMGMQDGVDDPQARVITADTAGIKVVCVYVPNGSDVESDKYTYKIQWLNRLIRWLPTVASPEDSLVMCGDFNIIPFDRDAWSADVFRGTGLLNDEVRRLLSEILDFGLEDVFVKLNPEGTQYTWWDYRSLGFQTNSGLRIDLILASKSVAARCTETWVDREERKGQKPSDHAPVLVRLD
ncbi:MAG TPA: exodeoxyribonuclease III [Myxococcota bacterium]|nr:exodeoxyribonuclease III [Myxococcota bacterium]HON25402.1 exodeoxyribonuclease III [Myxococcota bacterium]HOS61495.1 exodeoxyribonuclease III [Myxococcota bacterium]HPC91238.1 exodeoxyribonuclease III [Myxococcota bacterium]HPL25055.1 exodeoxyribonuclease III [Myxococcota bacterium]